MSGITPVRHRIDSLKFEDEIEVLEYEGKPRKLSLDHPETQDFLSQLRIQTVFSRILPRRDLDRLNELLEYEELELITSDESSEVEKLREQHKLALLNQIREKRNAELEMQDQIDQANFLFPLTTFQQDLDKLDIFMESSNTVEDQTKYIQEILTRYQGTFDECRLRFLRSLQTRHVEQLFKDFVSNWDERISFPNEIKIQKKLNRLKNLITRLSTSSFELTLLSITQSKFSFTVDSQNSVMHLLARKSNETTHDSSEQPASHPAQMSSTSSPQTATLSSKLRRETLDSSSEEPDLYARDVIEIKGQLRNIYLVALHVISYGLHDPITEKMLSAKEVESLASHFGLTNEQLVDIFISAKAQDRKDERAGLPVIQNRDPIATLARKLFEQAINDNNEVNRVNYLIGGLARISHI